MWKKLIYLEIILRTKLYRNSLEIDEGDPFNELLHAKSINIIKALNMLKRLML